MQTYDCIVFLSLNRSDEGDKSRQTSLFSTMQVMVESVSILLLNSQQNRF